MKNKQINPDDLIKLYRTAVRNNGAALEYVPGEFITEELCRIAVREGGYALRFVPEELKHLFV